MATIDEVRRAHPLATRDGLATMIWLLLYQGAMCPKCGYGTRATSRRWARCKRCGHRVERRALPPRRAESDTQHTQKGP